MIERWVDISTPGNDVLFVKRSRASLQRREWEFACNVYRAISGKSFVGLERLRWRQVEEIAGYHQVMLPYFDADCVVV